MITVYSPDHRFHHGRAELIGGQLKPCVERPERAKLILAHLQEAALGDIIAPQDFGLAPVSRVHDEAFLRFLESAHAEWRREHGDTDALPLCWPARSLRQRIPESIEGKLGYYAFDAGTPITKGTYRAALSSAQVALTGQNLISQGMQAAFALCRPPGHHAAKDLYGGYCFLNNAAIAAQAFIDEGARVTVLDVDYHHGNGTQAIFYDQTVLVVSLHADPAREYPYFSGYADETGVGRGEGYTLNIPLPLGTDWQAYKEGLKPALQKITAFAPDVMIVSLGVDTFEDDPISSFKLKREDYTRLGQMLSRLRMPVLFVMEGGYALEALGPNVVDVLKGFLA